MGDPEVRGAIDRYEGDRAVVVLDDGQQLSWPRSALPPAAAPGVVVRISMSSATSASADRTATEGARKATQASGAGLDAKLAYDAGSKQWVLELPGGSRLRWPFEAAAAPRAGGPVHLQLTPEADDTAARRGRVSGLLDDILGASG